MLFRTKSALYECGIRLTFEANDSGERLVKMAHGLTSGADFLSSCCNANDDGLPPSLVTGFESCSHDADIAGAIEGVVASAIRHLDQFLLDTLALQLSWVEKIRCPKLFAPSFFAIIDINDDDLASAILDSSLYDTQANAPGSEDRDVAALLYIRRHDRCTISGGDTTTK